jgi:hypothetical protein
MSRLSRRHFFGSVAAAPAVASWPATLIKSAAAAPELKPRKLPFPPNDNFGAYEPALSADGTTIWFARFGNNGDKRVKGPTDIFVTTASNRTARGRDRPETGRRPSAARELVLARRARRPPEGRTLRPRVDGRLRGPLALPEFCELTL